MPSAPATPQAPPPADPRRLAVYVAGGSAERHAVAQPMIDRLTRHGVTITHDWTRCEGYGRESTEEERRGWAALDMLGVETADVVWVMVPEKYSEGAAVEMGAALARGKHIIVSGPHAKRSIFALLAEHHDTHESAFAAITGSAS